MYKLPHSFVKFIHDKCLSRRGVRPQNTTVRSACETSLVDISFAGPEIRESARKLSILEDPEWNFFGMSSKLCWIGEKLAEIYAQLQQLRRPKVASNGFVASRSLDQPLIQDRTGSHLFIKLKSPRKLAIIRTWDWEESNSYSIITSLLLQQMLVKCIT
jgi:hypothetical protein